MKPVGAAIPVMNTSAGAMSAASMPPAPNNDQNKGALERFIV
jgi:hypothetical protein